MNGREAEIIGYQKAATGETIVLKREPLYHEELAYAGSAINNELSALLMASLVIHGPQTVRSFRDLLMRHGTDASVDLLPNNRRRNEDFLRLVKAGFATREMGAYDATYRATELGEGLGILWAGTLGDFSTRSPYPLERLLSFGKPVFGRKKSQDLVLPEGQVNYQTNSTEYRIRVGEAITYAIGMKQLPITVKELAARINQDEEVLPEDGVYRVIYALSEAGVIVYGRSNEIRSIPDKYVYRLAEERPDEPPETYDTLRSLTARADRYALAHPDEPIAASEALPWLRHRFPELYFSDQHTKGRELNKIFRDLERQGYLERHPDYDSRIRAGWEQRRLLREFMAGLRSVQRREPDGVKKAAELIHDPQKATVLLEKWNKSAMSGAAHLSTRP